MNRRNGLLPALTLFAGLVCGCGCSDVGDSSAVPGDDGSPSSVLEGAAAEGGDAASVGDATKQPGEEAAAGEASAVDTGGTDFVVTDAGSPEAGLVDASQETGVAEAGEMDSTVADTSAPDTGEGDAGLETGIGDTGVDSTVADGGTPDAEVDGGSDSGVDGGSADTGTPDAGAPDSGQADAGQRDATAAEAGSEAGGGGKPAPCTGGTSGANTPAGCIPCLGSENGVCTLTEAIVVDYDIATNGMTAATPTTKEASCYYCMVAGECLDSVHAGTVTGVVTHGKSNFECEDTGTGNDSSASPADCRDALTCTLTTDHCTTATPGMASTDPNASVSNCYCGTNLGASCISPGPNGPCLTNEQTDIGSFLSPPVTDPTDILTDFTTSSLSPGGVGNEVLNCALTALCDICFK